MFTFLHHRKYSRLLQEFVSCIQGLNCEVNDPTLFINEMKQKALACGDTLPDLTGINTGSGNTEDTEGPSHTGRDGTPKVKPNSGKNEHTISLYTNVMTIVFFK